MTTSDLFADRGVWACVEARLAAGDRTWLELWQLLRVGAPSGPCASAERAAANLLKHDPRLVFKYFGTGPCEVRDLGKTVEREAALAELRARQRTVAALVDYASSRDECLGMIEEAMRQFAGPRGE